MEPANDKAEALREYTDLRDRLGRPPSSRQFYKEYPSRMLGLLFDGGNAYTQLQELARDVPNRFSSRKSSIHDILRQWGELARTSLQKHGRLPIRDDWTRGGLRPSVSGIKKSHNLKWSEIPRRFVDEFVGNEGWHDVLAAIPQESAPDPSRARETEECYVYLMKDLRNLSHKIGMSANPWQRERTLQSEQPRTVLVAVKKYINRKMALAIEKAFHSIYDHKKRRGEHFDLDNEDLNELQQTLDDPVA